MAVDAVELLLEAYGRDKEIAEIQQKRELVSEKLKIFTHEIYERQLNEVEKLKTNDNLSENEELFKIRKFEDFEIFRIQYQAYRAIDNDIMNYDKILKSMQKDIKKARNYYKSLREMSDKIENLKLEWS